VALKLALVPAAQFAQPLDVAADDFSGLEIHQKIMSQSPSIVALQAKHFSATLQLIMNIETHVETLRQRLLSCPATRQQVSAATDGELSASWVSKFAAGRMANPRVDSLVALDRALSQFERTAA
jgi:hypothetical protein